MDLRRCVPDRIRESGSVVTPSYDLDAPAAPPHAAAVMTGEDARYRSGSHRREPDTPPAQPAARRRDSCEVRTAWMVQRERPGVESSPIVAVLVLCRGCMRPFRIAPPRFAIDEHGDVTAKDEGAAFRCTTCDRAIGPVRLAAWTFGQLGDHRKS